MNSDSKKAEGFLQSEPLQYIFNKIKELQEISKRVSSCLEPSLATNCQIANLVENCLIIIAANASTATQIRLQTPELLNKFRQDAYLNKITDILCKVRPHQHVSARERQIQNVMQPLSQKSAEAVKEIAQTLEDPKLREIMERIASHTEE